MGNNKASIRILLSRSVSCSDHRDAQIPVTIYYCILLHITTHITIREPVVIARVTDHQVLLEA